MGNQCEHEVQQIDEKQHDGNRDAQPAKSLSRGTGRGLKGRRKDQCDRRKREHRRLGTRSGRIEVLLGTAQSSGQHGGAEHQQDISDDGAGDRRLHHVVQPGTQRGERNDELGGIAERRVQEPANAFAHALRELLRGPAHPAGKRQNGEAGGRENEQIPLGSEEFQADRDRDKEQKPVHRDGLVLAFACRSSDSSIHRVALR